VGGGAIRFVLILSAGVAGHPAWAQTAPTVGNLKMPLVTPQQADAFFANRVVPPSDVPAQPAATSREPLQSVNVDPVLGHELPTDPMTPAGLPRADFATAKPGGGEKKSPIGDSAVVGPQAPASAVIRQEPPVIGKP